MSRTASPLTGRPYGLAAVCRAWRVPRASVYRPRIPSSEEPRRRPGPVGPMPDAALLQAIRRSVSSSTTAVPWKRTQHSLGPAAAALCSLVKCRMPPLVRENNLLAPSRIGAPRGPRTHGGTVIPDTRDTMWGTDRTTTFTGEGQAAVFMTKAGDLSMPRKHSSLWNASDMYCESWSRLS
jgi:putative transposase